MAVYDFVSSASDLEAIKASLDSEIEKMSSSLETINATFKTMNGSWKGSSYDEFMETNINSYSEELTAVIDTLTAFSGALDSVAIDAENLYTNIESICNGIGSDSSE